MFPNRSKFNIRSFKSPIFWTFNGDKEAARAQASGYEGFLRNQHANFAQSGLPYTTGSQGGQGFSLKWFIHKHYISAVLYIEPVTAEEGEAPVLDIEGFVWVCSACTDGYYIITPSSQQCSIVAIDTWISQISTDVFYGPTSYHNTNILPIGTVHESPNMVRNFFGGTSAAYPRIVTGDQVTVMVDCLVNGVNTSSANDRFLTLQAGYAYTFNIDVNTNELYMIDGFDGVTELFRTNAHDFLQPGSIDPWPVSNKLILQMDIPAEQMHVYIGNTKVASNITLINGFSTSAEYTRFNFFNSFSPTNIAVVVATVTAVAGFKTHSEMVSILENNLAAYNDIGSETTCLTICN